MLATRYLSTFFAARPLPTPVDWTTVADLKYFAGTAVCRTKAKLPAGYTLVEASQRLFSGSIVTFTASVFSPRASNVL